MKEEKNKIEQSVNGFKRILTISPPFDKRNPDPSKNYGIHGINLRMILVKDKKAVHFVAYLPVYLPKVADELYNNDRNYNPFKGMGADVGYHSTTPNYPEQTKTMDECPYTEGVCYSDGSALRAEEWYEIFLKQGVDKIWKMLEEDWDDRFGNDITL